MLAPFYVAWRQRHSVLVGFVSLRQNSKFALSGSVVYQLLSGDVFAV